ncbi:MAG: nitrilase-related carbon-nitrogen hydrolase [Beijerinckiaceae bacterium]
MSDTPHTTRVAIVQAAPVFLDAEASAQKAIQLIGQAAETGATLAAFGEGWIPGYPMHAFARQGTDLWWEMAAAYLEQSVDISGALVQSLCDAAGASGIDVVIGISERDSVTNGTAYSTLLVIGADGRVHGRDRKLKATLHERAVWGDADAAGLTVAERPYGVVSSLAGSDNQMALPAYALAEQGAQFHIAAWPGGEMQMPPPPSVPWPRQHLMSRALAAQMGAYVLCAAGTMQADDIPEKYRGEIAREFTGDSIIVDPRGEIIAGPAKGETILIADCRTDVMRAAKVAFDLAGHSARPDQLQFQHPHASENSGGFSGQNGFGSDYGQDFGQDFGGDGYGDYPEDGGYGGGPARGSDSGPRAGGWTSEPPPGRGRR